MKDWIKEKKEELKGPRGKTNVYLVCLILGLTLSLVHMDWLGETWGFGIIIGYVLLLTGSIGILVARREEVSLGTPWIYIPILIILASGFVRTLLPGVSDRGSEVLYFAQLLILVGVFLSSRVVGRSIFFLLIPVAVSLSVLSIIEGVGGYPHYVGGMGFTGNPNLTGSLLIFSLLFLEKKWIWLAPLILVGLFFTGDHWAVFGLMVVALVMVVRREGYFTAEWKAIVPTLLVPLVVVATFWSLGTAQQLYGFDIQGGRIVTAGTIGSPVDLDLNDRTRVGAEVLRNTSLLGHGGQLDTSDVSVNRYSGIVHTVPLMIWDDLGILASLAWVFLMGYLIYKSRRYRYQFILILVVSMFCYWYWTPTGMGPYFWALVGVASESGIVPS